MKKFHIGQLVSITTGYMLCENGISGVREILNFMTDDNNQTVALPSVVDECKPYLYEQHAWLREVDTLLENSSFDMKTGWRRFLTLMLRKYGEYHEVKRIHGEDHEKLHPFDDAKQLGFKGEFVEIPIEKPPSDIGNIGWKND
jgi:hypothetical protein